MTTDDEIRRDVTEMVLRMAGTDLETVKNQPMAFATITAEVAYHMGITEGLMRARDQIAARFGQMSVKAPDQPG